MACDVKRVEKACDVKLVKKAFAKCFERKACDE